MQAIFSFDVHSFHALCDELGEKDTDLKNIIYQYGYPTFWERKASFETLVHIILEQQVSLASAKAALDKLKEKIGTVTPKKILLLSDADLRQCYFSRQKAMYVRCVAQAIQNRKVSLTKHPLMQDEDIRKQLICIKGIGNWTADVYLMMVLHRSDLFPSGDIALINSVKYVKRLPEHSAKEKIEQIAENWRPYRTVAAFMLWHVYLNRKIKIG